MACYTFGQHLIKASFVFLKTQFTFAFVNLKPIVPGHVLLSTLRIVERFGDMTPDEVADLFKAAQTVGKVIERQFGASSLSVGMQDGPDSGQTVKHVHVHILPRKKGDFKHNDEVFAHIENHDNVAFVETEDRPTRTEQEMIKEAEQLRQLFPECYTKDL